MSKKTQVTLKAKILFGIIVLIGVTICFNLIYSHNLFLEDKKSYIFESALKRAEGLGDELSFKISSIRQTSFLISRSLEKTPEEIQEIFSDNQNLLSAVVMNSSDQGVTIEKQINFPEHIKRLGGIDSDTFDAKKLLLKVGSVSNKKLDIHLVQEANKYFFLVTTPMQGNTQLFAGVFSADNILKPLKEDRVFSNSLYWKVAGQKDQEYGRGSFNNFFNELKGKTVLKGVQELDQLEHKFLVAYVTVPSEHFTLISAVDANQLYKVTQALVFKTLLFGLVLLGFVVIAGILFSVSLTNPIRKLIKAANEVAKGNFDFDVKIDSNDEIKILSDAFGTMSSEIKGLLNTKEEMIIQLADANTKLEDYSKNLEVMVEQRTAELKTANDFMGAMVNSLDQGLVVFDQDLNCNSIYTKAAETIFENVPTNSTYSELLEMNSESEKQTLKQWATITFSGMLPFESAVGLAPKKREWGKGVHDEHYKMVSIDYFPMKDDEGKLINVVAVGTDKTKEVQAIESFKEEEQYVAMILKILNNKVQFESFISEVRSIFTQFKAAYNEEEDKLNLELCMMLFHTLNGGFGLYSLYHLQKMAQSYEEEINRAKKEETVNPDLAVKLNEDLKLITTEFNKQITELDRVIGTSFMKGVKNIEVSKDKIFELKRIVDLTGNAELKSSFYEILIKVPVINYFKAYSELVSLTAEKLNKEINPLVFVNSTIKIDAPPYEEFFSTMVHLFRNCVDHGIESPEARESAGKPRAGTIEVKFEADAKHFGITVRDDGAGINPARIREKLSELVPNEDFSSISDEEIVYKIFDPFFSTRDAVTSVSGRGVGMSAIKETVDKLGGKIVIRSKLNVGSEFRFFLPLF
jgi:two-component system chemotaxis sensor kinase CheA